MKLLKGIDWGNSEKNIEYRKISELKPHPENVKIYGYNENVSDLVEQITKSNGRITPLLIKDDNTIISGHRRYKACQQIGIEEVPVEIRSFENETDELEALVLSNSAREKTTEQKVREGMILEKVDAVRAHLASISNLKQFTDVDEPSHSVNTEEKGRTRDTVAKKVGLKSGRQYDRAKNVVKVIDKQKEKGNVENAELISTILNQAPSTAEEFVNKIDIDNLDLDTKQKIQSGEKTAYSLVEESKRKEKVNNDNQDIKTSENNEIQITNADIKAAVEEFNARGRGEIPSYVPELTESQIVINKIRNTIANFNRDIMQILMYDREINNFTEEQSHEVFVMLSAFEENYNKNKKYLIKENK